MKSKSPKYPYAEKGARQAPDRRELRIFTQSARHHGGQQEMPAPARRFATTFSASVTRYPDQRELPNWLRAMIEKKVRVEELVQTLQKRLNRAPTEENQELALIVANEVARMEGGSEALAKYTTPELLARLSGKGGQEK